MINSATFSTASILTFVNRFHILRLFDVLPNFPFTTSEAIREYYLYTWYILIASQVGKLLKT